MKQFFDSDVMNIDFIGTLVGNTVHHEGSGWSFFSRMERITVEIHFGMRELQSLIYHII